MNSELYQYCTSNRKKQNEKAIKKFYSRISFSWEFLSIKDSSTEAFNTASIKLIVTYHVSDKTTMIDLKLTHCHLLNS